MKGCYALLQQDNAALKLFSSQCKSSLVSKQKHLYPLLSRIRFELVSIMSLLTVPLRLETFQQIEKQVDSVNNPQHVFSLMFGYLGKVNLKHEQFITSSDYIQNILKLLRHISLMDTKLFNCTTYHCVEDTVVPHLIQQYKAAFVTGDLFEISHNTLALYQETQFLDTSRRLYQGSFTCCPGLGTLSISFHLLNLCLRSFSNVRFICGWIAECQQILSTVKTCFENPFSLRITKTIQKESIEPFEIASYLPFFLKTVYWDTLDYTVFHLTRVVPKKSYCLKKCISWNTEMLIVELIGISLVRLYGLVVYPRPAPPFDACQILSPNDHEHIASILANKSDSATLSFRITTPLVLLLGVNVYKKLSLWYSGRSKKVHFSKVFRNVMAEGIESCIFIEAPDSCTLEKTKYETTFFNVTVPQPTFLQNISLNKLWTVKSFGLWAYISDPLYFPSTLEVFDEEESSKHPVSGDSIVEEGDTKTDTTLTQTQLFGCLFNAWHHKWPCLQTYGTVNLSTFSALVKPEWHEDHNRKQWTSVLQSGSILSDSDTDHLLLSWMRRRDDDIPSSDDDTSAMNSKYLHLQTAMIHFVFDPESSVQWRPFTDFKHYKILMASILKKVYNDFWFGFNSYQQLLHTFFFQALPLRAALYLPKKLLEIGFEASLWGDAFSFFFKETQVAQPSYLTRSVLSYLPTSLLTNGAYSINSLEMNELLDNLANINRAASLGYINLKSFSAAAYTHRQLFLLLNDRFAAEECWPAILPFVETMPVDDILTEHDTVCFTCHNVVPAEIPMREGVQSLFLLRVENSLLGHSMYTQVKHRMPKSICGKEVKKNAGVNLNASYQASGLECEPIVSCDSNVFYDLNDPWYALATCPFVTSLQLYADCCKDTQEKHQFENSGAKLTKSCFVQEKSEKEKACVCEGCKNVKILEQCLIPVKQLQLLNFFDCFVLYARSRVESLLVQFSLCKLTSPVPSGITLSHLKSLRDHCDQKMVQDKNTLFFVYNWKGKREKNTADVLYLERINKVFFQAEELSFLFSNLTKMAGKPLLSILCSDDDTRDVKTPFKCYSLHTLKLLKSCIWIPDMILARCCLLKTKLYLYETKAVAPFLLKHYVIFLRAFVSLNKSLSYLNVQTKNNCLVTTPMTPKIQSWKTQLPSHLQCLSYHDAAPLIRLINLRSYLLLLGLYSGPSSHTNQLDVFRHLNHTQSTREFSPAKSREDNSATSTSPTYCSVPSFSGAPTLEIHDAFQLRTPHTQDQIFNSEKATFTQAHHDTWNSTETLECPSMNCVKPNVDGNSSITMNSSQCVYHNDDGLNESHETNSFSDLSISTRNLLVTNDSFSNVNQVPLQTSFVDKEDNIAWLLCSLCVWDKKLLTPQVCDELYELCNHYEKQLSMELKPNDSQKYHDAICDKLRREGASCTLFVSLQKDCFKGLNILASCFGKYFTNVYQTISRFHIFTGNPLEAVKQLEPLLSKSFNRNKHMDTKSSNTSLSKQSNTALLLYHQMLLYRLRHEEKIKYKTVIFLFIILELLLDENQPTSLQSSFNPSLGQERKEAEGGLTASVDDAPVISSRTITNLPAGMFHATILSHLPHTFVNHNKQSFTTRQWKILRRHQDNIKKRKINEILTYLIDLLHFYIRCAKKQATSQEAVLLNVPMDSKALSHVLCQCILIGLYMLAQSLSKQLSDASFILPWECVNPTVAPPRNHFDTAFITPQLVKQLSSIIPLFPKQYHFLAQRYTSFVHRMSNTLLVHEVHLTHPSALVLEELTPFNDITYVLALCHLACGGKASLALKVSKGKGVYQFVESAVSHHVEEYHSLHHIFKTLSIVEKETNTNRRIPCSTLDKFRKKMKRS
ncbi:uncharacterized protein LOC128883291 [Hylaeus volcanicus]|uniref:uncharacterized protein LOC128883291 n=1 Tax=Hylaeus volcanicus TaxID=313075 RepID=UPI0023B84D94|nr:uncharacterized protein LOC128883291 [Hylaeus volcanicus]